MVEKRAGILVCSTLVLAGLLTACSSAGPQGVDGPAASERFPVAMQLLDEDGGRLFVRQRRSRTAQVVLVAIHGGPGMQSDYLWELDRMTSDQLSFATYDQHGAGRSRPADLTMTMDSYTAELERVVDYSGHPRAILFAHSWGALVAVNYAAGHPEQVVGLILMGPAPLTFQELSQGSRRFRSRVERLLAEGHLSLPLDPNEPAELLPVYFADPAFRAPDSLTGISYSTVANVATWQTLGDYDFVLEARSVRAPAIVLWGAEDPFGSEWGRSAAQAIGESGSPLVILEGCGHYWHECPEPFYEELEGFLEHLEVR